MIFEVADAGNYLAVGYRGEVYKLPRWFCREVGLAPGRWEILKDPEGIALIPRGKDMFEVMGRGRYLRSICYSRFKDITGVDVLAEPGRYSLRPVKEGGLL